MAINMQIQCFADDMDFFMFEDENVQEISNSTVTVPFAKYSAKVSRFVARIFWFMIHMLFNVRKVGLAVFTAFVIHHFQTYGEVNFTIPFTTICVELGGVIKSLISWSFFDLGPVTVFISPCFLCPFPLLDYLPFTQSFVALKLWNFPVTLTALVVNLHVMPCINLCLPSLTTFLSTSSLPKFSVSLSLVSLSAVSHPIKLISVSLFSPLWSLLTLRLSDIGLGLALLPISRCKVGMSICNPNTSESTPKTDDEQAKGPESERRQRTDQTETLPTYFDRFTRHGMRTLLYIAKVVLTLYGSVALYQFVTNGGADFLIPFTDITMDFAWLLKSLPLSKMFIHVGPVTVFISPLSFSPFPLPDFMPFKQSFVCLKLWDFPVPLEELFINLRVFPTLYVYLPSLSSFSLSPLSLPSFPVSLSLVSLSTVFHPIEVIGAQLICPLWSLLTFRLSNVRLRMRLFPGHRQMPKSLPSAVTSTETNVGTGETYMDITEVKLLNDYQESLDTHLISDNRYGVWYAAALSAPDHVLSFLIGLVILSSRNTNS